MSLLSRFFGQNENKNTPQKINSYQEFWDWFLLHEKDFFEVIKQQGNFEEDFFDLLSPKLEELRKGFYLLAGMMDDHTAELIITVEGVVKNVIFAEELIAAAPEIAGWKFTALKPESDSMAIGMDGHEFGINTLNFVAHSNADYPDEIAISVVYDKFTPEEQDMITNGVFIFLDNFLGELNFMTQIDAIDVVAAAQEGETLVPISKLKDYLLWREKEFVEKYAGIRHDTQQDKYAGLQAELNSGMPLVATVNQDLLQWDAKPSHPWIVAITIAFNGEENNGMPTTELYTAMDVFEDELMQDLKDHEGYLNVARETAEGQRRIYLACKDFRKPSKMLDALMHNNTLDAALSFKVYKDKYWYSLEKFNPAPH